MICLSTQELGRAVLKPIFCHLNYFHSTSLSPWFSDFPQPPDWNAKPPGPGSNLPSSPLHIQSGSLSVFTFSHDSPTSVLSPSSLYFHMSEMFPIKTQVKGYWLHENILYIYFLLLHYIPSSLKSSYLYPLLTFKILPHKLVSFLLYLIMFFKGKNPIKVFHN